VLGDANGTVIDASSEAVELRADLDQDGTGALREAPGAVIDLTPANATDPATPLTLIASEGIGTSGAPIAIRGGGELSALNAALKDDGDPTTTDVFISNPDAHSGVFVTNTGSGDLTLANGRNQFGIQVTAGDGDIEITNDAGDLLVQTAVQTKPIPTPIPGGDPIDNGPGGDITFTVNPGNQVVLDPRLLVSRSSLVSIASGRKQTYEGDVELARNIA